MANYTSSFDTGTDSNLDNQLLNANDHASSGNNDIESGDLTKQSGVSEGDLTKQSEINEGDLTRANDSSSKAGDFREAKNNQSDLKATESTPSLREVAMEAKRKNQQMGEEERGVVGSAITAPARKGLSSLLRSAWINLVSSFGLTLIWINIHVFLGMVFGKNFFCKLGEEWTDRPGKSTVNNNETVKQAGKAVGTFESMGLACLDLGCFMLLIAILSVFTLLMYLLEKFLNIITGFPTFLGDILTKMWDSLFG